MKSFLQYLKFRENDGEVQKVASPGEMPMAKASGDDAEPIVIKTFKKRNIKIPK